jgi:hypothetical protein
MLKMLTVIAFAAALLIGPDDASACDGAAKSDLLAQPGNAQPELLIARDDDNGDDDDDDDDDKDDD